MATAQPGGKTRAAPGIAPVIMDRSSHDTLSFDELADAAQRGDGRAEATLFDSLRVRFTAIAKRRVREDDLDDIVQDALQIVHARHGERRSRTGLLVWSLAVLRNVIGNYYQARARESRRLSFDDERGAAIESAVPPWDGAYRDQLLADSVESIQTAIGILARDDSRCARIFRAILSSLEEAEGAREISHLAREKVSRHDPGLSRNSFYVALHRCRARLRAIVAGLDAGPGGIESPGIERSAPP